MNIEPHKIALNRMSSKDLVYKSLYETINTVGKQSIIEELNDMNYLERMFGSARSNNFKTLLILLIVSLLIYSIYNLVI